MSLCGEYEYPIPVRAGRVGAINIDAIEVQLVELGFGCAVEQCLEKALRLVPFLTAKALQYLVKTIGLIDNLIPDFADHAHGLVDRNGLELALNTHTVELAVDRYRRGFDDVFRHENADPVFLGKPFEPRRQVHGVAHNRIRTTELRTHVADAHLAAIHADADMQNGPAAFTEIRSHCREDFLHIQCRCECMRDVVRVRYRGAPERHDGIANVFVDGAAVLLDHLGHG